MNIDWRRNNSLTNFFFRCSTCDLESKIVIEDFLDKKLHELLNVKVEKLDHAVKTGVIKFFEFHGFPAMQFKKDVGMIETGTVIYFRNKIEIIRGFPKIRRTLMLSPTLKNHFNHEIALEEKMNGYNVRIASIGDEIVALTRRGYVCPYTTKKALEIMNLEDFFQDNPDLVICGEMLGTENPYVSHYYEEIGDIGFRAFDIRKKVSNEPMSIKEKTELLEKYNLPVVRLIGIYETDDAPSAIKKVIKEIGNAGREGIVIKDPSMEIPPLKYTSSEAHADELRYAFTYPFDFGRDFFFSRVIREGFQAFEMEENEKELQKRAQMIGEAILYPMVDTIKSVAAGNTAGEDLIIDVKSDEEAEDFLHYLHDLGVFAVLLKFEDNKAVIRKIHQSTTDKITNYIKGGLY
jgi:RNA ligase, Pab1020 family